MGKLSTLIIGVFWVFIFILGLIQIPVGFIGINDYLGMPVAIFFLLLAIIFRIMLPFTIGSFVGAYYVLELPWYIGLAIAFPGILFITPALVSYILISIFKKEQSIQIQESNQKNTHAIATPLKEPDIVFSKDLPHLENFLKERGISPSYCEDKWFYYCDAYELYIDDNKD